MQHRNQDVSEYLCDKPTQQIRIVSNTGNIIPIELFSFCLEKITHFFTKKSIAVFFVQITLN